MKLINIYSITQEFNNDLTTPMAAYLKLNESDAFFLESVEKGTAIGRYSMIGFDPLLKVHTRHMPDQGTGPNRYGWGPIATVKFTLQEH